LAVRLYTPNWHNLGAKSSIVSSPHLKYSRFSETRARDRARSALLVRKAVNLLKETPLTKPRIFRAGSGFERTSIEGGQAREVHAARLLCMRLLVDCLTAVSADAERPTRGLRSIAGILTRLPILNSRAPSLLKLLIDRIAYQKAAFQNDLRCSLKVTRE